MPATLDVACPNCGKALKVPAEYEGKKIKCKDCQTVFPVRAAARPAKAAPTARPVAKAAPAAPPPPAAPEKPKSPFLDDDDDEDVGPNKPPKPMNVVHESDAPRCPHCAKEMDPPDAIICIHCGFNNRTRVKSENKVVFAPDAADWTTHLLPGILALALAIGLIVVDIICLINMPDWVAGSALEKDDKDPVTGKVQYYVKPGALTAVVIAVSVIVIIPAGVFGVIRLAKDYKPEEKRKR